MAAVEPVPVGVAEPVGERMKRSRRKAGLSVEFMAAHFEVSKDAIRSWEQSRHQPANFLVRLEEWARLTDVSYTWLLTGSVRLVTYADSAYGALVAIDEGQLRLSLELPPSRSEPSLTLV